MSCRARKQTEFEKRKAAFAKLIGLLMSMMKRRALYDVLPLDPTAWPVLLAAHLEAGQPLCMDKTLRCSNGTT